MTPTLFNPRVRSLTRANILVIGGLILAMPLSGFPHLHTAPILIIPAIICMIGTAETVRCIQRRWSLYHGGVILCIYMDLMVVSIVLFYLLYPYFAPFAAAR